MEKQMNIKRAFLAAAAVLMLPGFAMAQSTLTFDTTVSFMDDNDATVKATLTCNNGVPLVQFLDISPDSGVNFVVTEFDLGNPDYSCEIEITDVTGYVVYEADANGDFTEPTCVFDSDDEDGFNNLDDTNSCDFLLAAAPVTVSITKEWVMSGAGGNTVDTDIYVTVWSDGEINGGDDCYYHDGMAGNGFDAEYCAMLYFSGNQTRTITVVPADGGTVVYIYEEVFDSSVETDNGCGGSVTVAPAVGGSCLITNTVFFEGIPTLNQYGLAIMALLMLGVGFVGFRRFV